MAFLYEKYCKDRHLYINNKSIFWKKHNYYPIKNQQYHNARQIAILALNRYYNLSLIHI